MIANSSFRIVGTLTPPDSLDLKDAVVEPTLHGLKATGVDGFSVEAPWRKLRVSKRLEGVERSIHFPDGRVFQSTDDDSVDGLLPEFKTNTFERLRAKAEHEWGRALIFAAAACIAIVILFNAMVPVFAGIATQLTPDYVDNAIGNHSIGTLEQMTGPSSTDPVIREIIQDDFRFLADRAGFESNSVDLKIVDGGPIGANALAVPGGLVMITDQLIAASQTRDEVVGVLAHELGHLHHRHGLQQVYRSAAVSAALYLLVGGEVGLVGFAGLGAGLLTNAYSRDMEREADDYAVDLVRGTGFNPIAFGDLLVRLEEGQDGGPPALLRTHPMSDERLKRMRDRSAE